MSQTNLKSTVLRRVFLSYICLLLCFSTLYLLPISSQTPIPFIDALFLSASGLSVTGLSTIVISEELTRIGQSFLLLEMQIGGIGIMAVLTYVFMIIGKKLSFNHLMMMRTDQNQNSMKSLKKVMLLIVLITFICESIGLFLLYPSISNLYDNPLEAFYVTLFHSVSSFVGAGFDLFGNSLLDFSSNPLFISTTAILIFLGALGFPTIIELFDKRRKKLSLFSKVNLSTQLTLLLGGFVLFFLFESSRSYDDLGIIDKVTNAIFLSSTARNGGLSTVNTHTLTSSSILLLMMLMFIGAAPSSCGGGIRTTTFAVLIAKTKNVILGNQDDIILFKKSIPNQDFNKAFTIASLSIFFTLFSIIILSVIEDQGLVPITFEVVSAFTTTGLSMGITQELSTFSKLWLIILMFIGRIGVIAWMYFFIKQKQSKINYVKESIIVG